MYREPEWKQNMRVPVSKFEVQTIAEMGRRNLHRGLTTNEPIVLWFCAPDLKWDCLKRSVFLDGIKVHSSERAQRKDQRIKDALEERGWKVLRIRYTNNPSITRKKEIWDGIEAFLRVDERFTRTFGKK